MRLDVITNHSFFCLTNFENCTTSKAEKMIYPMRKFIRIILAYSFTENAITIASNKYENIFIKLTAMYFGVNRVPELTATFNK